jgi:adenine-specific DNA-methyltransferase
MLINLSSMSSSERQLCEIFISWGVLATIVQEDSIYVAVDQFHLLKMLQISAKGSVDSLMLFDSEHDILLSNLTGLSRISEKRRDVPGNEVLVQLLPRLIQKNSDNSDSSSLGRITLPGQGLDVLSRDSKILDAMDSQIDRFSKQSRQQSRTNTLARSANYMGAKTLLCPAITEVLESYLPQDGVVLDLMCGSGATTGAFAQRWKVYASDAQAFSRHLALIQGGGMTGERAKAIVSQVVDLAKPIFAQVTQLVGNDIEKEEGFLMSEMSAVEKNEFVQWAANYPRINTQRFLADKSLIREIEHRRNSPHSLPPMLFTRYYANLFFGVRQSAEIDSLRAAINKLEDSGDRKWALGALICAVSACADNYGGHFAQPRFDSSSAERLHGKFRETFARRTMSITQEFSARLISLGKESEHVTHTVDLIEGPWQHSLQAAKSLLCGQQVTVYLDPPYTRDEYSRYYHVLETLVRYDYPRVDGKASIPVKGENGRFASEFFTRSCVAVEETISKVISNCLENQWSCLWSYSSSGAASIPSIIDRLGPLARYIDVYKAKYTYKPQGKRKVSGENRIKEPFVQTELFGSDSPEVLSQINNNALSPVDEYMIMIRPR